MVKKIIIGVVVLLVLVLCGWKLFFSEGKVDDKFKNLNTTMEAYHTEATMQVGEGEEIRNFFVTVDFKQDEIDNFRKRLYSYQELVGMTDNNYFFNNYYISMMEKLDKKFDNITEEEEISSTYLVKRKESKLFKLFIYIKHVLLKKEFENDN